MFLGSICLISSRCSTVLCISYYIFSFSRLTMHPTHSAETWQAGLPSGGAERGSSVAAGIVDIEELRQSHQPCVYVYQNLSKPNIILSHRRIWYIWIWLISKRITAPNSPRSMQQRWLRFSMPPLVACTRALPRDALEMPESVTALAKNSGWSFCAMESKMRSFSMTSSLQASVLAARQLLANRLNARNSLMGKQLQTAIEVVLP